MLRITIELLPGGYEEGKKHLGTVDIWNDAKGTKSNGSYKFRLSRRGQPKSTWKTGELQGFPRRRLGAYDLLLRVLTAALGDRNPTATQARTRKHVSAGESPKVKAIRVRITKSGGPRYWYANQIGQVFEVVEHVTGEFAMKADMENKDPKASVRIIRKDNCEVLLSPDE